ncbi:GGDEF domain-containing protein [Ramlibacter sp. H39-3-26]|uniref:GGDEF domain-containing protein n=1 Tax=Curvibacter soli TaxID=3031331 RepID=UPI0023DB0204|nr:GGDEF domain-containing protein [Ramlibacter sp. H39-3-26]MDF1485995.1 GGDEF domain-containing protein [Ramlibacter sp. H39-3-26]
MSLQATTDFVDLRALRLDTARSLLEQSGDDGPGCGNATDYLQGVIDGLCNLSQHDPLTGLANRRTFRAALERELDRVARSGESALLLMLDIDHFKAINDTHGHTAGDAVLQALAHTLANCVRPMDTLARYGGEEFAVVMPACQAAFAFAAAERIRCTVADLPVRVSPSLEIRITVSIGGAFAQPWVRSTTSLWSERADQQLYAAKDAGRDCVRIELPPDSTVTAEEKSFLFSHFAPPDTHAANVAAPHAPHSAP